MSTPVLPPELELTCSPAAVSDAVELSAVFNAAADADDIPERLSPDTMEHELAAYFDPLDERSVVVRDQAGGAIGYATIYLRRADAEEIRCYINVHVDPGWRDRGIEEALIDWGIAGGRAALQELRGEKRFICAWLYRKQEEAAARYAERGFTPIRHWWEMERILADPVDARPEKGFAIVPWEDAHDEPARLVYNSAFADHWGSTPMDRSSWHKQVIASPGFRREYSCVAIGDGEVVGYSACDEYPEDWESAGRKEAWISGLGVVRDWRKRGIATALLSRSMVAMGDAGIDAAMIGVDSDNTSGAQHLYSSLGFVTKTMGITWQLEVD